MYDMNKPEGSRVAECRVRCAQCRVPKYEPINKSTVYKVLLRLYFNFRTVITVYNSKKFASE